jgi:TctA family transporter
VEELTQALARLGDPIYWAAVTGAVFVAGITGIIPGASGILVMSLSIPFIVFNIDDPAIGLVMLATMTGVNNTLDSIPAVLLGQPGAATQVTFLEGHQLARKGKAAHTLGAVYAVSALGGIIGAFTLAAVIPVIKPFILKFGFAEIAAMGLFGIAMVSALSAGAMVKGLAAGMIGIMLGTVGINGVTGDVRYVFQQPSLWGGLPLIATTLGLFALPEMLDLTMTRKPVAPPDSTISTREVFRGAADGLKRWKIMIRQSLFGVVMGAIPGVGAAVIDWLAYAFGIFFTKDKSEFGKGSLDGVLFAESAQNSKEAGQAIPTLALGVPGGLAWALVLVAMLAYNLPPGPPMLGDKADVTILLVITLGVGNLMVTMLGMLATGQLAKLTLIPYPLIGAVIIPIAFLTGFINMISYLALPIMFVFAGMGIIMKHYQWPRPPLLLGIILGKVIEDNLLSAINVYGATGVATRPLTIILVVLSVATAVVFARSASTRQMPAPIDEPSSGGTATPPPIAGGTHDADTEGYIHLTLKQSIFQVRNIPPLIALGGAMAFFVSAFGFLPQARYMPMTMASGVMILSVVQIAIHIGQRNVRPVEIMDLGMKSVGLPGAKQAALLLGGMFAVFVLAGGFLSLKWGALLFAALGPILLMEGPWRNRRSVVALVLVAWVFVWVKEVNFDDFALPFEADWWLAVPFLILVPVVMRVDDMLGNAKTLGVGATVWMVFLGLTLVDGFPFDTFWAWVTLPYAALLPLLVRHGEWRFTGAVFSSAAVGLFVAVMVDRVLFALWPEAAFWNFITTRIF